MRNSKHFIMLLARAKLRFSREQPDDFFSVGNPVHNPSSPRVKYMWYLPVIYMVLVAQVLNICDIYLLYIWS